MEESNNFNRPWGIKGGGKDVARQITGNVVLNGTAKTK